MKSNILFAISVSMVLAGCASQQDVFILRDRIVALEQRNMDLQQRSMASEKDKVRVERALEEKDMEIRSQSAGLQAKLDKMSSDIQMLGGKIDETSYALTQRINALEEAERRKGEVRSSAPSEGGGVAEPGTRPVPAPSGTRPAPAGTQPDRTALSEDELYNFAKEAFDKSDFEAARDGFQKLLKSHPKSKFAESAQFWVGESYFRQKWYEKAILEYQGVIEKYPKGNKVRAALLKQGLSFIELGDRANGRLILQELVQKYPNSEEGRIAKQKLK